MIKVIKPSNHPTICPIHLIPHPHPHPSLLTPVTPHGAHSTLFSDFKTMFQMRNAVRRHSSIPAEWVGDVIIVGSGIIGSSIAHALSRSGVSSIAVVEAEDSHGYHSTGRSAALYSESYGSALTRALTTASRPAMEQQVGSGGPVEVDPSSPSPEGGDTPFLRPRGVVWIAREDQMDSLENAANTIQDQGLVAMERLGVDDLMARVPALKKEYVAGGLEEADATDIDVNALHAAYIKAAKAGGGVAFHTGRRIVEAVWDGDADLWALQDAKGGVYAAPIVVNAAGAWADELGVMAGLDPIGLVPKRRTVITFDAPADDQFPHGPPVREWPMVFDVDEQFYFKPDAGQILASPADATPVEPHDAYPEDMDVAYCADRVMTASNLEIASLNSSWAGLRTFAPDSEFVLGPDPRLPSFVWAAGMGGYGIQTAPAVGDFVAAATLGDPVPSHLVDVGITSYDLFSPIRPSLTTDKE